MKEFLRFLSRCIRITFIGDWRYQLWMLLLTVLALLGLNAYCKQLVYGLVETGMSDHVSWGLYIANFTFFVGIAAAVVMLVIFVYVYRDDKLHDLVIFGELFAVAVIVMCLLFVTVDLGRPDRFHHLLLRFNFPISMLTWDVIGLNGYLLLNLYVSTYLIYCAYRKREPRKALFVIPFVLITIVWAISIQLVEAFLYVGLSARPFWNNAIIAPRLLASAFAAGPAIIILTLQVIDRFTSHHVPGRAMLMLRQVVIVAMTLSIFLLISELFTEFYAGTAHISSTRYLYFGLHGYDGLVPWIWSAIALNVFALVILYLPIARNPQVLSFACILLIVGVWIEKGMGLVIPAFIPTPLGEIVEYTPTINEVLVCIGIWAFGLLVYTAFVRVAIPVLSGRLTYDQPFASAFSEIPHAQSSHTSAREKLP
ncbi:MAG: polysulfide reductase NrfD [Phycisphaerales bacterium]|nr:polysulfide reductase NrfD [Phycisphaerales bacterium]